jgi:hypothetical protein
LARWLREATGGDAVELLLLGDTIKLTKESAGGGNVYLFLAPAIHHKILGTVSGLGRGEAVDPACGIFPADVWILEILGSKRPQVNGIPLGIAQ